MLPRLSTHRMPGMSPGQARTAAMLELPVLVTVLAAVPVLVLTSLDLGGFWGVVADVLNWAVWLAFLLEAVVMLVIAPDRAGWARRNPVDLAVVALTPPFLPEFLQFLWVLRLLRILDLLPVFGRVFRFNGFRYAAVLAFLAVFGGGLAYAEIEEGRGVDEFDGVWWALTTITTVGYGDEFPHSPGGRVLGMGMMLLGPVVIGLVATGVGAAVARQIERDLREVSGSEAAAIERLADEVEEVGEGVAEVERDVSEVGEDVEALSAVDRMIIERLDAITRRLDGLEAARRPE